MCTAVALEACDVEEDGVTSRPVPVLQGSYGSLSAPRIASFVADDPDNFDEVYGVGDTLTIKL